MNKFWYIYVPRFIIIISIVAFAISMMLFPGGNHLDTNQIGYSFTKNFISELGRFKSMSGDVNFFSSFIFISICCLNIFLGISFLKIPKLFKQNKISYVFALIGGFFIFIGCLFYIAVGFTPEDLYFQKHIFVAEYFFNTTSLGIIFFSIAILFSRIHNLYASLSLILIALLVIYAINLSHIPEIDPANTELYAETYSMETQIFKVIMQKLMAIMIMINIYTFTFGINNLLNTNDQ